MSLLSRLFGGVPSVGAQEARALIDQGAGLVDVRSKAEWNAGHSPLAQHVALDTLGQKARRIPKSKPVVVMCRTGNRSRRATRHLREAGYEAYNLSGGMNAWARAGQAVVDRSGRPGRVG
jgi:rhodanese-related sulfurtransferase